MFEIVSDDLTDEEIAAEAAEYGALAASVRKLIDATIRTELRGATIDEARRAIDAVTASLSEQLMPGSYGVRFNQTGTVRTWGNAASGLRNPIAPPLDLTVEDDGRVWAEVDMGAAYEGPPTLLHGGISALLMDQALGRAAEAAKVPGLTGTLNVVYRRATRLGRIRVEAQLDRVEGVKTFVTGTISDDEGVCLEATGVFILPKWARAPETDADEAKAASSGFSSSANETGDHPS